MALGPVEAELVSLLDGLFVGVARKLGASEVLGPPLLPVSGLVHTASGHHGDRSQSRAGSRRVPRRGTSHDSYRSPVRAGRRKCRPRPTPLEHVLAEHEIDTLVVVGGNFPNCPRATLVEASERDYCLVAVTDAISRVDDRALAEVAGMRSSS